MPERDLPPPNVPALPAVSPGNARRGVRLDGAAGTGATERSRSLADLAPCAAALTPREDRPAAYVCVDHACRLPVTDASEFAALLDEDL